MKAILLDTDSGHLKVLHTLVTGLPQFNVVNTYSRWADFKREVIEDEEFLKKLSLEKDEKIVIVCDLSETNPRHWNVEIEKIKKRFNQNVFLFLATHERPELNRHFLNNLSVDNVLFRPYDELITAEIIFVGIQKTKMAQSKSLKLQESKAFVGLLKEVEISSLCELGFTSISDVPIPLNSMTLYYSKFADAFWAQCVGSVKQSEKNYINRFHFVSVRKETLNKIRRFIQDHQQVKNKSLHGSVTWLRNETAATKVKIVIIGVHNDTLEQLKKDLLDHYLNAQVEFLDFALAIAQKKQIEADLVLDFSDLAIDDLSQYVPDKTIKIKIEKKLSSETRIRELMMFYQDILLEPLDKSFFYKKIIFHYPFLAAKEIPVVPVLPLSEKIKAANKAKIVNLNETIINFDYPRQLAVGEFREFIFIGESDSDLIEIPGYCHFSQPSKQVQADDPYKFFNQFIFFAVNDHHLKEVRKWLLKNYIQST